MVTINVNDRWQRSMMNNYGTPSLTLVSGKGAEVVDSQGKKYLDLLAGIAVNVLGHGNAALIEAVTTQLATLGHVSNLYATEATMELAETLLNKAESAGRVFFSNSGTEANEAAFKIARLTGRPEIIAAEPSFHGRTMGALAMTGQPAKRAPFEPMPGGVRFVPYGDAEALQAAIGPQTAAVILEPILGESGVVVPPDGYLAAARELTSKYGALLILDEVQTGIGRTGHFFAHQHQGIVPDVITLAKGLGGGLPIGATLALGLAAELLEPGMHGSTFGGNPVCAAAALAVIKEVDSHELVSRAAQLGKQWANDIEALKHPLIAGVRGAGLLLGIVLTQPVASSVELAARQAGYLVNAAQPEVIRLAPPLIISDAQAAQFVSDLPMILTAAVAP